MSRKQDAACPTRTCVGCGRRDRQFAMLRLKHDGQGRVVAVSAAREGRSAYLHATGDCVRGLARSKVLQKSLRQTIAKEARLVLIASLETELAAGAKAAAERDRRD